MKKILVISLVLGVMLSTTGIIIAKNQAKTENGLAHREKVSQLYLYEKDADWNIVEGGAWGKMIYSSTSFVFNGHGLDLSTDYTLLRYEGQIWPTVECLASGVSNNGGNINLKGEIGDYGDKVWLVLTEDVDCDDVSEKMNAWNPTEYLFENNTI